MQIIMQAHNGKTWILCGCTQNLDTTCFIHSLNILNNQNSEYGHLF